MSAEHVLVNNAFGTLAAGLAVGDTALSLTAGHGARFPAVVAPQFMYATLVNAANQIERVLVTAHAAAADTMTMVRAQDGTTALAWSSGDFFRARVGKGDFDQLLRRGMTDNAIVAGGATNAITGTLAVPFASLPDNFRVTVIGATANQNNNPTFNLTLGVTATGPIVIVKGNQQPLAGGDLPPVADLIYKASFAQWVLLNPYYGALQAGDYVDSGSPNIAARGGFVMPDGSAISRAVNAALLQALTKQVVVTITIASPGVVTWNAHGIPENGQVTFATTGALPSGLGPGTVYYAQNVTANTFNVAATPGGAVINTTGSQSGVHTGSFYPHGAGDGSTTFNVPDRKDRVRKGQGAGSSAISVDAAQVNAGTDAFTIPSNVDSIVTGMQGQFTTTGALPTGLSLVTNYWLVRTSATTFKVATSLLNAQNGTVIDITLAGSGVHTFTQNNMSTRTVGQKGGEETHGMSSTELLAHLHQQQNMTNGGGVAGVQAYSGNNVLFGNQNTASFGGNAAMNNESPYGVDVFWVKT